MMRSLLLTLISFLALYSCKPYQTAVAREGQITYEGFRQNQKTFTSSDGAIAFIDEGEGDQVIVLLHGVPTSGWLYRKMIDPLVVQGYRVVVPDMLGYGSSDNPKGYELYSEENHAKRLLALMDHLKIQKWTHIMHDAGGLWTWELIEKDPSRIEKLIILNSIIYEEGFDPPIRFKKELMAKTAMWSYRNGISTNMMLKNLFHAGMAENQLNKIDVEGYKKPLREGKTRGMYYFFTQTCGDLPDYASMIKKINIPTMVIWGKKDEFLLWNPQAKAVTTDLNILAENVHIIDAKHFIQEEKPTQILAHIKSFLK